MKCLSSFVSDDMLVRDVSLILCVLMLGGGSIFVC